MPSASISVGSPALTRPVRIAAGAPIAVEGRWRNASGPVVVTLLRNGAPVERFLTSETAGVRRLLEIIDPSGMYSRGELDTQLRTGKLDYKDAIPAWTSEIAAAS